MPEDLVADLQSVWKQVKGDPAAMAREVLGRMPKSVLILHGYEAEVEQILSIALAVCRNPPERSAGELWVESLVSGRDKQPYVSVQFREEAVQMTIAQARHHAILVIECIEAAISDAFLVEFMRGKVGIDEDHIG